MLGCNGKISVKDIKDLFEGFQQKVDEEAINQHLNFTAEIWTSDKNLPPSENKDKVQTSAIG